MIEIVNLTKKYPNKTIFDCFNLKVEENSITAIVGSSGSGKSTLLNMVGLLDYKYDGDIIINNVAIKKLKQKSRQAFIRNNINYLFQDFALIEAETVEYNLLLALEYVKANKQEKKAIIAQALMDVGLEGVEKQPVYTLSGGEQQRIALARTIIKPGNLILTDEPTGNLDHENSENIFKLIKDLKKMGKTVLIVTHNLELANHCDAIIDLAKLD